jgi:hypothetical protein
LYTEPYYYTRVGTMKVETASPLPLGTNYDLPVEIRKIASLRSEVIAWTKLDPDLYDKIDSYYCNRIFFIFVIPCFWPHLVLMWPCLCAAKSAGVNGARNQYWILTQRELKIVSVDHDTSCIPGLFTSGNDTKTIPLENITDCGVDNPGQGRLNVQYADLASIHVDTASSPSRRHEAVGIGLANHEELIRKILNQRDLVKGSSGGGVLVSSTPATPVIASAFMGDRTSKGGEDYEHIIFASPSTAAPATNVASSVADRINVVKDLYDSGVLTQAEYEQRRQEIIASI